MYTLSVRYTQQRLENDNYATLSQHLFVTAPLAARGLTRSIVVFAPLLGDKANCEVCTIPGGGLGRHLGREINPISSCEYKFSKYNDLE